MLQYDFGKAAGDSLLFLDAQRIGTLPASNSIPWRGNALQYENATKLNAAFKDLSGGWMQGGHAGDFGPAFAALSCSARKIFQENWSGKFSAHDIQDLG